MAEAKSLETSDPAKANADYIRAWRIYSFGSWPFPSSPGKQRAYAKALEAFRAHTKFWDPKMEIVHIPFEGKEVIGYLRLPKSASGPVPLVIAVNGLDSRKEDLAESFSAILPYGIGFLAVDGPGTGEAPDYRCALTTPRRIAGIRHLPRSGGTPPSEMVWRPSLRSSG